jgi:hypothetical protein
MAVFGRAGYRRRRMATSLHSASNVEARRGENGPRLRSVWRRPTTWLAAGVLAASAITALVVANHGPARGSIAAKVGPTTISDASVDREVAAIQSQPLYRAVLSQTSTLALAAPVTPQAVAAANGDPDDLRVTFAAPGARDYRPYTTVDLKAAVLTRLIYLAALQQVLTQKHISPTTAEMAWGQEEAGVDGGQNAAGANLFDQLPKWYQDELAGRGAALFALTRGLAGPAGVTAAEVQQAYLRILPTEFTTWCLRSLVVPAAAAPRGRATLLAGGPGVRDDGCAALSGWAPDVQAAVREVAVGQVARPVVRGQKVALLLVGRRVTAPLTAVEGNVRADLEAHYSDAVSALIDSRLALDQVSVASQYGTYMSQSDSQSVVPPDALTPPLPAQRPTTPTQPQRQQQDPFE